VLFGKHVIRVRGAWFVGATLEATSLAATVTQVPLCTGAFSSVGPKMSLVKRDTSAAPKRIPLKIISYAKQGLDATYVVVIQAPDDRSRPTQFLCGANGSPVPAMPLAGVWNPFAGESTGGARLPSSPDQFTFACLNGALGKCAHDLGYRPWETKVPPCRAGQLCQAPVNMAPLHQACTRMIRADYCGDGTAHTVSGVQIDLYDRYGFNKFEGAGPYNYEWEASWDDQGATNLSCARRSMLFPAGPLTNCPSLNRPGQNLACVSTNPHPLVFTPPTFNYLLTNWPTSTLANAHADTVGCMGNVPINP
jgi:hypothetical protein